MRRNMISRKLKTVLLCLCLGALLSALWPAAARAERSFTMDKVLVETEVLPDASMIVTEKLTVDFSGQWNGFYVKIPQGSTPVRDVAVRENDKPYTFNPGKDYGPPGTFLTRTEGGSMVIDWSISARDETRTFDVSYRVVNAVKIHDDAAELYRKFIGGDNQEKIPEVKVTLKLPVGAEKYKPGEDIRIWGHGPLQGEVNFAGADTISWGVTDLPVRTFLEGRVVMPTALFPKAPPEAHTGRAALAGILAEEEDWARDANRQRWLARAEMAGAAALIVITIGIVFLLWRRYGRAHAVQFDGPYYRDLPAPYSPAELSVLWNHQRVKGHDLTATLLDLARRKFLQIDEENVEVRGLLGTKEVKAYRLTFLDPPNPATIRRPEDARLREHELELLEYLHQTIAEGRDYLYLHDIEKFSKKYSRYFYNFWQRWTAELNARGEQAGFFDHSGCMPLVTLLLGLALFTLGAIVVNGVSTIMGVALIISGSIIGLAPRSFKRRSLSGQEDFARWQAFKRFLLHFSQMQRHEIPSLIIWEHYLVYAVTLGVAREVMSQLELVFPNMQDGDYRFGQGWYVYGAYTGFDSFHNSFNGIGAAVERSINTAQKAVSRSSSGSGGGGGFSGGGGGGGGGSSYGGR
ncbi:MAG: DUF2207 domain-containing protein [Firmicutes bacterium]|nr:DUF2207 domain-containing protein [Bacillota bacterium]